MTGQSQRALSATQAEVMQKFYSQPIARVVLNKSERHLVWEDFRDERNLPTQTTLSKSPALEAELRKALDSDGLIQSAVFSECVYAQTLANMLGLNDFYNFNANPSCVPLNVDRFLSANGLRPRYVYKSKHSDDVLIQAGGAGGVDCALVSEKTGLGYTIEFKEPGAKTSEPDLPKYGEDGYITMDTKFIKENAQFTSMLQEQIDRGLNIWEIQGSNVHDFDPKNVQIAVSENYAAKKFADVICVEDENGFLTMIPANQADVWAEIRGEIRPTGRNHYKVWTPLKLAKVIASNSGVIRNGTVSIPLANLGTSKARGGDSTINRYKIDSIFFVRPADVCIQGRNASFDLSAVRQVKPTISAHMFFKNLDVNKVRLHYKVEF
jgi:hypothetical protein